MYFYRFISHARETCILTEMILEKRPTIEIYSYNCYFQLQTVFFRIISVKKKVYYVNKRRNVN